MLAKRVPRGDGCSVNGMAAGGCKALGWAGLGWGVFRGRALAACSSRVADVLLLGGPMWWWPIYGLAAAVGCMAVLVLDDAGCSGGSSAGALGALGRGSPNVHAVPVQESKAKQSKAGAGDQRATRAAGTDPDDAD